MNIKSIIIITAIIHLVSCANDSNRVNQKFIPPINYVIVNDVKFNFKIIKSNGRDMMIEITYLDEKPYPNVGNAIIRWMDECDKILKDQNLRIEMATLSDSRKYDDKTKISKLIAPFFISKTSQ